MTLAVYRFMALMLCAPFLVAILGAAAAYSGHHMADVPDLLTRVAVMALLTAPLAYAMFRPIARFDALPSGRRPPVERLQRLAVYAGLSVFALTAMTVGSYVGNAHGSWQELAAGPRALFAAMLFHVALFALCIGLFVYFLVVQHMVSVRRALWESHQVSVPPGGSRIGVRIFLGFTAIASVPLLFLVGDLSEGVPHSGPVTQAVYMDLAAAAILTATLVVVLTRVVSEPVRMLVEAVERVDAGDLRAQLPVVSDDELGFLTGRFNRMVRGLADRERVRRTFSRFVPAEIADALIADEGAIAPQEREATVLYADIEGFTRIAASLSPREILDMLNDHFEGVAAIIHRHRGVITQFQGDAVLAGFNLPAQLSDHARCAVEAAIEIAAWEGEGPRPVLRMRVGVATGVVVGGTVGGSDRLGYTLHGDTVNLAARLEELNKELGTQLLADRRTAELLRGTPPLVDLGVRAVRGFAQKIRVFEIATPGSRKA